MNPLLFVGVNNPIPKPFMKIENLTRSECRHILALYILVHLFKYLEPKINTNHNLINFGLNTLRVRTKLISLLYGCHMLFSLLLFKKKKKFHRQYYEIFSLGHDIRKWQLQMASRVTNTRTRTDAVPIIITGT